MSFLSPLVAGSIRDFSSGNIEPVQSGHDSVRPFGFGLVVTDAGSVAAPWEPTGASLGESK